METPSNFLYDTTRVVYGVEVHPYYSKDGKNIDYVIAPQDFEEVVKAHILKAGAPCDHRVNLKLVGKDGDGELEQLVVTAWITAAGKTGFPAVPQPLCVPANGGHFMVYFCQEEEIRGAYGLVVHLDTIEMDFAGYLSTNTEKSSGLTTVLLITNNNPEFFYALPLRAQFEFIPERVETEEDSRQKRIADFRIFITQLQFNGEI